MKRCAIIGTAPSWQKTPWDDPSLEIWSLNDAYLCKDHRGQTMPRADRWFELHPLNKFVYRRKDQKLIQAGSIPPGHYVRPDDHIDWLKKQAATIPVYLQNEPPAGWPANAKRFPIEAVEARFGTYWASGPSYMVALAIMEGYEEIHVYGIHLSTDAEYREQRPQFEHILGIAKGLGIKVVMADESPVLKHGWKYGYEPKPQKPRHRAAAQHERFHNQRAALLKQLAAWPWWKSKAAAMDRLRRLEAMEQDCILQMNHAAAGSTVVAVKAA